jgi:hypothetical protein
MGARIKAGNSLSGDSKTLEFPSDWTLTEDGDGHVRVASGAARPIRLTTSGAMLPSTGLVHDPRAVGIDTINDLMLVAGSSSLFQYTTFGTVASTDKTQPAGAVANSARKAVKFKGNWYFMALQAGTVAGIWKAAPQSGNTAFTWTLSSRAAPGRA